MKKLFMLCIVVLLVGCGQLRPQIELTTVALENEAFKIPSTFSILTNDFEEKLFATTSFKKIELADLDDSNPYIYQHEDKRIQLEIVLYENSQLLFIYLYIHEARPLQDEKLTADVYDALKEVVNILEENAYDKTIIQDLLAIRTIQELQETGKVDQLADSMRLTSSVSVNEEGQPYFVFFIEPLFETE